MGSNDADPVKIGYEYRVGVHYIFCQSGITNVRKINLGKKELWSGNVTSSQTVTVYKPSFFGGLPPDGSGGFDRDWETM